MLVLNILQSFVIIMENKLAGHKILATVCQTSKYGIEFFIGSEYFCLESHSFSLKKANGLPS